MYINSFFDLSFDSRQWDFSGMEKVPFRGNWEEIGVSQFRRDYGWNILETIRDDDTKIVDCIINCHCIINVIVLLINRASIFGNFERNLIFEGYFVFKRCHEGGKKVIEKKNIGKGRKKLFEDTCRNTWKKATCFITCNQ